MVCEWCLRMKLYSVVVCILPLSLSRIAKRVVELCKLPPWKILSMLNHPFSHNPHLSTRVHTIRSIPSQGRVHTIQCTRMRAGVELCHSPPRRFSQPVVHYQESPLVSYASYVCESDRPLLNSRHTQTRLTFPREEEEDRGEGPLPLESRILLNHEIGIYTDSCGLPWVNVGLFRFRFFLASV